MADLLSLRLMDGTPLSEAQMAAVVELQGLVERTISTRELQIDNGTPELVEAARNAYKQEAFLSLRCLRRYLSGDKWQAQKSYVRVLTTSQWRNSAVPPAVALAPTLQSVASLRYAQWVSMDSAGRPNLLIVSRNARHKLSLEHRMSYMIATFEKGVRQMAPTVEQWNVVIDETDSELKHFDLDFIKQVGPLLQNAYADRLHCVHILNPGIITRMVLGIVKLIVDDRTQQKIRTWNAPVKKGTLQCPQLLECVGNLPPAYGGTAATMSIDEYCTFLSDQPTENRSGDV